MEFKNSPRHTISPFSHLNALLYITLLPSYIQARCPREGPSTSYRCVYILCTAQAPEVYQPSYENRSKFLSSHTLATSHGRAEQHGLGTSCTSRSSQFIDSCSLHSDSSGHLWTVYLTYVLAARFGVMDRVKSDTTLSFSFADPSPALEALLGQGTVMCAPPQPRSEAEEGHVGYPRCALFTLP